jgi:glycosyltransferase involved in cell wall biosynthesis
MHRALGLGKPIIALDCLGAREVIRDKYNGFLISDKDEFVKSILFLYENQSESLKMGNKSREIAEMMSWENVSNRTLSIYKSILN